MDQGPNEIIETDSEDFSRITADDIEDTRTAMSGTIAAIADKVNPHALAVEAKDVVAESTRHAKDAATEVLKELKETLPELASNVGHNLVSGMTDAAKKSVDGAVDSSRKAINGAVESAKGGGMSIIDHVKKNPIAAIVAGAGIYWLLQSGKTSEPTPKNYVGSDRPEPSNGIGAAASGVIGAATDKVSDLAGQVHDKTNQLLSQTGDTAGHIADRVSATANQGGDWFQRTLEETPLAIGALAVVAGLIVGLSVPETKAEHKLMGAAKDDLVQKAQSAAVDLGAKVQSVAEEAVNSAKDEAANQGLALAA